MQDGMLTVPDWWRLRGEKRNGRTRGRLGCRLLLIVLVVGMSLRMIIGGLLQM
jgi:hypothetical protein